MWRASREWVTRIGRENGKWGRGSLAAGVLLVILNLFPML